MTESQRKNAESQRKTPDREKVIKGLECIAQQPQNGTCGECAYFRPFRDDPDCGWCDKVAIANDALALLREQEPVKPRWTHPAVDMNVMMCGSCGIEIPLGKPNYCPWCGRQVKWNDAE